MFKSNLFLLRLCRAAPLGIMALCTVLASLSGCGPAQSVYHDGNFSAEQKAAAQAEYQTVEDEESQGSNKKTKKKPAAKR
jgi:outer membrane lipoprotein-sorting protein